MDALSASFDDDKIAWYPNSDSEGRFGLQRVISRQADGARFVSAADLDGDGDQDVLSASADSKIAWYENMNGEGHFGEQKVISRAAEYPLSLVASDLDGDGDLDVLFASVFDDKIAWSENKDGKGNFAPLQIISLEADYPESVAVADLDADGDLDVLSASAYDDTIAWYENTDGKGTFGPQKVISSQANVALSVASVDLDGDGDFDVLAAYALGHDSLRTAWYENTDEKGTFGPPRVIIDGARVMAVGDLDGDGDVDALSASFSLGGDTVSWHKNQDGRGSFGPQQNITQLAYGPRSVVAADLDGDADLDVLSASVVDNKVAWYENTNGKGGFGPQRLISSFLGSIGSVVDLDGDSDRDLLAAVGPFFDPKVVWLENTDGTSRFGPEQVIPGVDSALATVADLDRDGDADLIWGSRTGEILWYENIDGKHDFSSQRTVGTIPGTFPIVHAADLDGDGDLDVLSNARFTSCDDCYSSRIDWFENIDGKGSFALSQTIGIIGIGDVVTFDVDIDGDLDLLSTYDDEDDEDVKIVWYENVNGRATFGPQQVIATGPSGVGPASAADVDGDGDFDVLSSFSFSLIWYENTDGKGSFGAQRVISDRDSFLEAADVDGDGDVDVLSAFDAGNGSSGIAWYENTDGKGTFDARHVITTQDIFVSIADLDGDGHLDVLSAFYDGRLTWHEQRLTGDVNDDRVFDSADLVLIFQASEYEDGSFGNSTFDEGDWNGDGEFDSADLVRAFQAGHYETAGRPGLKDVAAAVDAIFARTNQKRQSLNGAQESDGAEI